MSCAGSLTPRLTLKNSATERHRDFLRVVNAWPKLSAPIRQTERDF